MSNWYVDQGLAVLITAWKKKHPGAVVGTIADDHHSTNPDKTQHAPDRGGSKPGDDKGEVDAADFMPEKGVTAKELDELFDNLVASHDKRILLLIHRDKIMSSVVSPFKLRQYHGPYHEHVHVSVNDEFDNNQSPWKWETAVARTIKSVTVANVQLPETLQKGDEDGQVGGWNHIGRAQALANWLDSKTAPIATDGVYGVKSAIKFGHIFGGNGNVLTLANLRKLHGI